jgi:hypothetical protein
LKINPTSWPSPGKNHYPEQELQAKKDFPDLGFFIPVRHPEKNNNNQENYTGKYFRAHN